MHNSKVLTDKLVEQEPKTMPRPGCNPDQSPRDIFLFRYLNEKSLGKQSTTPGEWFSGVETIISEIPSDLSSRVFATWQERLKVL
jgi:hypothetical protein